MFFVAVDRELVGPQLVAGSQGELQGASRVGAVAGPGGAEAVLRAAEQRAGGGRRGTGLVLRNRGEEEIFTGRGRVNNGDFFLRSSAAHVSEKYGRTGSA